MIIFCSVPIVFHQGEVSTSNVYSNSYWALEIVEPIFEAIANHILLPWPKVQTAIIHGAWGFVTDVSFQHPSNAR